MAKQKKSEGGKPIESYEHRDKERINNPPVGLVTPETDSDSGQKKATYQYDPHFDPQLVWAGKAEHLSFEVPTVSLHVHERIDPRTIIESVRKTQKGEASSQLSLFAQERKEPLRSAVEFYKHKHGWTNRLVAGDSLLVMNSLLEKEGMADKVQMVYIDPPYGIKYGSNFQPFVNKRDIKDGKDDDLTSEPEQILAFRDTWELGIHSYLTYLRDRLMLARELLTESGSIFVQISVENVHHVRELMDEVYGVGNFVNIVAFATTSGFQSSSLARAGDYLVWYAKDIKRIKYHPQYCMMSRSPGEGSYRWIKTPEGSTRGLTKRELTGEETLPNDVRLYQPDNITSQGKAGEPQLFKFRGKVFSPTTNSHWKAKFPEGMKRLEEADRLHESENSLRYIRYADDFQWQAINNIWSDTLTGQYTETKVFVVQTNTKVIQRCILMATDPGDLVLDPTCGSGTTAFVAEQWGRRWITCDTSRVALTLAKQRLMTAVFDYHELAHPEEGVGSGFKYKTVPHVTLKSIANNPEIDDIHEKWQKRLEPLLLSLNALMKQSWEEWEIPIEVAEGWPKEAVKILEEWWDLRQKRQEEIDGAISRNADQETLYDQPFVDKKKLRVSGPFTVEAVPAPSVKSPDEILEPEPQPADLSIARSGETLRQGEWRDELLRTGIRGKGGQTIDFCRLEPLPGLRWLHADGETKEENADRVVISFGPEHAPLEQRQVAQALEEALKLFPKPKLVVFAAFQFDPEAAKDIDETNWPGVMLLKAQMNADLLTADLKKKRSSNESFWLIGQPDISVERIDKGPDKGKHRVTVNGFDYYNPKTGQIESGGQDRTAVWLLDTDYDGRSLYPHQVFFPMAGESEGWSKLAKNLKAEIDQDLIEAYRGTVSLPFNLGENKKIAVKIVDDRGIESLKILEVD